MATDKLVEIDHVKDLISREAAISEIMSEPTDAHYPSWYAEKLKQIPAADVRPVVRARWIEIDDYVLCPKCGTAEHSPNRNFCHACGADMREVQTNGPTRRKEAARNDKGLWLL